MHSGKHDPMDGAGRVAEPSLIWAIPGAQFPTWM